MQDQRIAGSTWLTDQDEVASVILSILLKRYPALVAIEELVRELSEPSLMQCIEEPLVHDALADLLTSGLVHRLDRFAFPTQSMMRALELST